MFETCIVALNLFGGFAILLHVCFSRYSLIRSDRRVADDSESDSEAEDDRELQAGRGVAL